MSRSLEIAQEVIAIEVNEIENIKKYLTQDNTLLGVVQIYDISK